MKILNYDNTYSKVINPRFEWNMPICDVCKEKVDALGKWTKKGPSVFRYYNMAEVEVTSDMAIASRGIKVICRNCLLERLKNY